MKIVHPNVKSAIRSNHVLNAVPRLVAEWNMNRYFDVSANNIPSEDTDGFDVDFFPITSIYEPNRPTKGINKARINEGAVTTGYDSFGSRYYVGSVDDKYKYWTSPVQTAANGIFPVHTDGSTKVRPYILYSQNVSVNKIVIKVENYWASPLNFNIRVNTSGGTSMGDWISVATQSGVTIANDGSITLYWNGTNWSSTKPSSMVNPPLRTIRGVMFQVDSMTAGRDRGGSPTVYKKNTGTDYANGPYDWVATNGANSFFNLIEISARREVDLSDRLMEVSDDFDMSDVSELYPVGTITTNTGTVKLSNLYTENGVLKTGYFSVDNPTGLFTGLIEKNVVFNLEYIYTVNGTQYAIQQFKLYSEDWGSAVTDEVDVELKDFSKFFDETYPRPALFSDLTVSEIIQRLLDSVGYVDWDFMTNSAETDHIIPNFWVDGEKNIWEILDDLAKATQTAIYFDSYGKLKVLTRSNAFNRSASSVWTLRAKNSGTELADIVEINQGDELGANHLTVTYKTTEWSREVRGFPALEKVWEPDGDSVVLRASSLVSDINDSTSVVQIPQQDAKLWPYSGMFEIQGEIFRYNGKRFCYYTYTETVSGNNVSYSNETPNYVTIKSEDDFKKYNRMTPSEKRGKNHLTGGLALDDEKTNRGVWNSEKRNHSVDINNWTVSRENGGNLNNNSAGMNHNKNDSSMRINSAGSPGPNDLTVAMRGAPGDEGYKFVGTEITLVDKAGKSTQEAGMILNCQNNLNGYYVELKASKSIANKDRDNEGEVTLYNRTGNSYNKVDKANFPVVEGLTYQLDAQIIQAGSDHKIVVYINGKKAIEATITSNKKTDGGQVGLYVRGSSMADFQYAYALRRELVDPEDDGSFFNLKEGGYTGGFWYREAVWGWKTVTRRRGKETIKKKIKWKIGFFDEFGPIVHEVREFDVKFDPSPVLHSRLYMTNEWSAICPEYTSDPFGARFFIVNAARENAVIHGDDSLSLGGGTSNSVSQILTVIGRALVIQDAETVVVKDEDSIKKRGKVEAEIESDWIQSKTMAEDITEWMKLHWSQGVDQLNATVFGNPLIELGDVVSIEYPERFLTAATHKYFVVGTRTSFDNGITTELRLRRVA